VTIVACRCIKQ